MPLSDQIKPNKENEAQRSAAGVTTFNELFDGTALAELLPKPLKCGAGQYPTIKSKDGMSHATCASNNCQCGIVATGKIYPLAVLAWNKACAEQFDPKRNHFHPMVWYTHGSQTEWCIQPQLEHIETTLKEIEAFGAIHHKERRLIRLIRAWIDFAEAMLEYRSNKVKPIVLNPIDDKEPDIPLAKVEPVPDSEPQKTPRKHLKVSTAISKPYPIKLVGPIKEYVENVQHIGDSYYLILHGHFLRIKRCPKTQWDIPTYIVYVANKNTKPAFQVRIDLRSIGQSYYSKLHRGKDVRESLESALVDLSRQLKSVTKIKKTQKMVGRANSARKKSLAMDDNSAVRFVRDSSGNAMSVEVSLSAPNNHAIARFSARIGSKLQPNPDGYALRTKELYKLSVLHTRLSNQRRFANGADVPFNRLSLPTQRAILELLARKVHADTADIAHHLCTANPLMRIGYLPLLSLREDCELSSDDVPFQLVSTEHKDGYLSGPVKRHDLLKNAQCVVLDALLQSNIKQVVSGQTRDYMPGQNTMAVCLSNEAINLVIEQTPELDLDVSKIKLLDYDNVLSAT